MPTIPQSTQTLFNDHQARMAAVSAASGVVGLSLELDQIGATYLSKAIQILVKPKYTAHANTGTNQEDKSHNWLPTFTLVENRCTPENREKKPLLTETSSASDGA
jgi:hypothetical protein